MTLHERGAVAYLKHVPGRAEENRGNMSGQPVFSPGLNQGVCGIPATPVGLMATANGDGNSPASDHTTHAPILAVGRRTPAGVRKFSK